ncbi:MAG: CocE/NonD family hydrolase, partial [Caulobacteraceae bacterium]
MCLDFIAVEAQLTALAASLAQGSMPKLPPAWVKGDWSPGPEKYGLEVDLDVPIEMSDGVVIRALVGYPTEPTSGERASGLFPVLLEQSPYHHRPTQDGIAATVFALIARFFVARGYIYVSSQVRGTHNSGGEFGLASEREQEDGAELVEWAAHQLQGSSGRVGLTGCSYTGLNQYFTAARVGKDSPVKAIAPTGTGPDWYREPGFLGGIPTTTLEKALFEVWANTGTNSAVRFTHEVLADFKAGGPKAFDGGFWQTRSASRLIGRIVENQIPALIMAYWRDYPTSPGEAYAMFQNAFAGRDLWAPMAPDQAVTPRYQLIMGSEAHCAGRDGGAMAEATLRWFDTWLKGVDAGLEEGRPSLHLNDLDSDRWLSCGSYPPVSRYQTYYLRADGRLDSTVPAGDCESDRLCYAAPV